MTGLIHFSVDATSNGLGAAPINFQEGQAAGSVNNSARFLMAALACWREDNGGALLAGGVAGNLLTLNTQQGLTAATLVDGYSIAFRVNGSNTGPVTLNVDTTSAKPLRRPGNIELGPGDLSPDIVFRASYSTSRSAFIIVSPTIERPGQLAAFGAVASVPPGWRRCDGTAISRTAFAALFDAVGTAHGAGNGTTTFNVPDGDGRTIFGADNGKGRLTAAGGLTGAVGDVGGSATTTLTVAQLPNVTPTGSVASGGGRAATNTGFDGGHDHGGNSGSGGAHTPIVTADAVPGHTHSGTANATSGHAHGYKTAANKNGTAGSGSTNTGIWAGAEVDAATDTTNPTLTFTTNSAGGHTPSVTAAAVPAHQHSINAVADHRHTIPAVPAHDHGLTMNPLGSGQAHPNMPPGLVAVWAIKA